MQNPHNFFSVPPNSSVSVGYDPGASLRPQYMTHPSSMMTGDNSYSMNPSMGDRSYQTSHSSVDGSQAPLMNMMSGMLAPPRLPHGIDLHHGAPRNVWSPGSGANQRETVNEVYRQFQLHRASDGTPPVFQSPGQFPAASNSGVGGAVQFGDAATSAQSGGVDMSMLLAQVMSVPLATAFLQGMMANTPGTASAPPVNPFPVMPPSQNPMINMMQQMFQSMPQTGAPAISVASSNQSALHNPVPQAPTPPQSAPSAGSPQAIQLPPMDATVAKTLLLQLAQQLQQAGQLPNDDTFQNFLRTVQSPGVTTVTSTCGTGIVKVEVKKEPIDCTSSMSTRRSAGSMKNKLMKQAAKSETPDEVVPKTEDEITDVKLSKSGVPRVSSSSVYIDVAESAKLAILSDDDDASEFDLGINVDDSANSESSGSESLTMRSGVKKKKSKSGYLSSSSSQKSSTRLSLSPVHRGKASEELKSIKRKKSSKADAQTSRVENAVEARARLSTDLVKNGSQTKKASPIEAARNIKWNQNIRLQDCFVKLTRIPINHDSGGRIILPNKESRVARLKQHKVSINVLSTGDDARCGAVGMPKLEAEVVPDELPNRSVPLEKTLDSVEMPKLSAPRPLSSETSNKVVNEKQTSFQSSLQVAVVSNVNSSKNPQLRSMYMGLPKDNMEWLSLVGCIRNHPGFQPSSKQYCQCAFCPSVGEAPRDVALHIRSEHFELTFALNKIRVSTGSVLYICCRHCDFVAVEPTIMWIHFEIHHNVPGILDSSGGRHHAAAAASEDPPLKSMSLDDSLAVCTSFVCFDCGIIISDKDTNGASTRLARHALCNHPDTPNYNGCFVKLLMLQYIEGDARGPVTYRQAIYDQIHERSRREVFVCMLCRYSAFCPYLALSHNLMTHQTKHLLYVCSDCSYQCFTDSDMLSHNASQHRSGSVSSAFTCSATLVKQSEYGSGYVEYGPFDNRKSVLVLVRKQAFVPEPLSIKKVMDKPVQQSTNKVDEEKLTKVTKIKAKIVRPKVVKCSSKRTKLDRENVTDDDIETDDEVQSTTVSSSESRKSKSAAVVSALSSSAIDKTTEHASASGLKNSSTNKKIISESVAVDNCISATAAVDQSIVHDGRTDDVMQRKEAVLCNENTEHVDVEMAVCKNVEHVSTTDNISFEDNSAMNKIEEPLLTDACEVVDTTIEGRNDISVVDGSVASNVISDNLTIPNACMTTTDEPVMAAEKVNTSVVKESLKILSSDVDGAVEGKQKADENTVLSCKTVDSDSNMVNHCQVLYLESSSSTMVDKVPCGIEEDLSVEDSTVHNTSRMNVGQFETIASTEILSGKNVDGSIEVLNPKAASTGSDKPCDTDLLTSIKFTDRMVPILADTAGFVALADRSAFSVVQSMMVETVKNLTSSEPLLADTDELVTSPKRD